MSDKWPLAIAVVGLFCIGFACRWWLLWIDERRDTRGRERQQTVLENRAKAKYVEQSAWQCEPLAWEELDEDIREKWRRWVQP